MWQAYAILAISILAEVVATSALKATHGLTRLVPTLIVIIGYAIAFYGLTRVVQVIPIGVAYAIWTGMGVVLVTLVAIFLYQQKPDWAAILGMGLIVLGTSVLLLFSRMKVHG
ncbi:MAG: multidrug efflux SMR transporter [Calditrichaeota bacterium]|nr:multidrug efflux SMR transporter [Calditrichota bacterium]